MVCPISLESCQRGIQFFFRPHFNLRFKQEVVGFQSCESPNFGNSWNKMTFGCMPQAVAKHKKYYKKGRWWLPPSLGLGKSCESVFAHGSSMHQKCFNYAVTNLLFGLCNFVWIIDSLVIRPNPHLGAPAHPSTFEVFVSQGAYPNSLSFHCFHI
jgi:hypothetical protein